MLVQESGEGRQGSDEGSPITPPLNAVSTSKLHQLRTFGDLAAVGEENSEQLWVGEGEGEGGGLRCMAGIQNRISFKDAEYCVLRCYHHITVVFIT